MAISAWLLVAVVLGTDGADARVDAAPAPPVAPTVRATRWPLVPACRRPTELEWDSRAGGKMVWSSDDGGASLTVSPEEKQPIRLANRFPIDRLTRVTRDQFSAREPHQKGAFQTWLEISCPRGTGVAWGTCGNSGDDCAVSAMYPSGPIPQAARMSRWTHPLRSPWADEAPELHYSLFHKLIGDRKRDDPKLAAASLRFARDAAADFRELIAFACRGGRCAPLVHAADAALAAFLADKAPRYASDRHAVAPDSWSVDWVWSAAGGGTTLRIVCWDQVESPVLGCHLDLDLPGEIRVEYHPLTEYGSWQYDVAFTRQGAAKDEEPLGTIDLHQAEKYYPWSRIHIAGQALALRPPAAAPR